MLNQEIERLHSNLRKKGEETDQMMRRIHENELLINKHRECEDRNAHYEQRISLLVREVEEWKSKFLKLEHSMSEFHGNLE